MSSHLSSNFLMVSIKFRVAGEIYRSGFQIAYTSVASISESMGTYRIDSSFIIWVVLSGTIAIPFPDNANNAEDFASSLIKLYTGSTLFSLK